MKAVAVILAGGTGTRSGFSRPKQLVKLAGRPVIAHALEKFQTHPLISEIAVVSNAESVHEIEDIIKRERLTKVKKILVGGSERYESSLSAIRAYETEAAAGDLRLLFHDAVRPLVSHQTITNVIEALDHYTAVDTAVLTADTVIMADSVTNTITEIPDRRHLRLGQTPQGFHYDVIKTAYERALKDVNFRTTDDCGVVLKYAPEHAIFIVDGAVTNVKLTYADDLLVIDKFMQAGAGRRLTAGIENISLAKLRGKVVIIFGGTSGIGASLDKLATAYGAHVISTGRSKGIDIGNVEDLELTFKEALAAYGRIDAVINTAAILTRQPLSTMTLDEIAETVRTNILGALNIAKLSYPFLMETRGHLLLFASSSYTYGRAFYSTYSASKAAIVNLTQALADEWIEEGIKVNCINPERSRTPMRTKAFGIEPESTLLDPDEVARKALGVIMSDTTGYIYDIVKT